MKIIGQANGDHIVQISVKELAHLCGKEADYRAVLIERDGEAIECQPQDFRTGDVCSVGPIWDQVHAVEVAYNETKKAVSGAKSALTKLQNSL